MPACAAQMKAPDDAPDSVKKAVRNAPRNVLIGIGKHTGQSNSQLAGTIAEARARTAISRQLNTIVRDMITAYRVESSLDASAALAFEENITTVLSGSTLTGSTTIFQTRDDKGTHWAVVTINRNNAMRAIQQAQTQSRSTIPAASGVDITVNINNVNNAFDSAVSQGPQVVQQ